MTLERDEQQGAGEQGTIAERKYVRTSDNIPVYYEHIAEDEDAKDVMVDWELLFDDLDPSPEENPKLYELLFDINQKVNILINFMSGANGFNMPEARDVNISGGGLRFYCNDDFNAGDKLVLKTFLPTHAHVIKIKCEVVRAVRGPDGRNEVAVKYLDMDEATRDKIIRYIFAKQRKLLRDDK